MGPIISYRKDKHLSPHHYCNHSYDLIVNLKMSLASVISDPRTVTVVRENEIIRIGARVPEILHS